MARTDLLIRALASVLFALIGWLGLAQHAQASAAPTPGTQIFSYDSQHLPSLAAATKAERGPPATHDRASTYDAVDRWSDGASARPDGTTTRATYGYDHHARLAPVAQATGTNWQPGPALMEESWSPAPAGVAANAGTHAGPPRDALGRFTSGAGGESATTAAGRGAHANYANTLGGGNYVFNRALPGSRLRPDAVDYSQNIVRELKPGTPAAISRGWRQVNQYKAYLEELTDQPWTAYVDVYTP